MRVPAGYTYAYQPADIEWNRPLKEHLRKRWIAFLLAQVRAAGPGVAFRMVPPKRTDVVHWVKSAWMSLTEATIIAGFRKAHCLPIACSQPGSPFDAVAPATDWESLVRLLRVQDIPIDLVDPAHDIEESETLDEACV